MLMLNQNVKFCKRTLCGPNRAPWTKCGHRLPVLKLQEFRLKDQKNVAILTLKAVTDYTSNTDFRFRAGYEKMCKPSKIWEKNTNLFSSQYKGTIINFPHHLLFFLKKIKYL